MGVETFWMGHRERYVGDVRRIGASISGRRHGKFSVAVHGDVKATEGRWRKEAEVLGARLAGMGGAVLALSNDLTDAARVTAHAAGSVGMVLENSRRSFDANQNGYAAHTWADSPEARLYCASAMTDATIFLPTRPYAFWREYVDKRARTVPRDRLLIGIGRQYWDPVRVMIEQGCQANLTDAEERQWFQVVDTADEACELLDRSLTVGQNGDLSATFDRFAETFDRDVEGVLALCARVVAEHGQIPTLGVFGSGSNNIDRTYALWTKSTLQTVLARRKGRVIVSQGGNAGLMEVFGQVGCAFGNVVVVSFTTSIAVANGQGEQPAHGHCHHSYSCQSYPVRELGVVSGRIGALDLTGFNLVLRGTGGTRREMSNPHGQRNVFFKDEWWRPDREHLLLMEDYGLMTTAERAERFVFVDDPLEIEFA